MSVTRLLTSSLVCKLIGSGGKGACHQIWHSELKPQNPEGGKRDQTPSWIAIFHVPSLQCGLFLFLGFLSVPLTFSVLSIHAWSPHHFHYHWFVGHFESVDVPIIYSLEVSCQFSWFTLLPESFFVCQCAWPPFNMHMCTCTHVPTHAYTCAWTHTCMYVHTNTCTDRHLSIKLMQNSIKVKSSFRTSWLHNNIDSFQPGACCDIYSSLLKTPFSII